MKVPNRRHIFIKLIAFIFFLIIVTYSLRACREWEIVKNRSESLSINEINSEKFPWSKFVGKITSVKNYREAFDIDSNGINWSEFYCWISLNLES